MEGSGLIKTKGFCYFGSIFKFNGRLSYFVWIGDSLTQLWLKSKGAHKKEK